MSKATCLSVGLVLADKASDLDVVISFLVESGSVT